MDRREALVISTSVIMCLAFTDLVKGAGDDECRKVPCDKATFDDSVYKNCILPFNQSMATTDYQLKCPWPNTRRYYIELMMCVETFANFTCCKHVSFRHKIFMEIHQVYFSLCSYMKDPGLHILLVLIATCAIITFMIPLLCQYFKLHESKLPVEDH